MTNGPDYLALLKLLPILRNWVDATREVMLTAEEAARIRALGFVDAEEGRWKVWPVPPWLVRDSFFEYLSNGWERRQDRSVPTPRVTAASRVTPQARPETRDLQSESFGSGKVHHSKEEAEGAAVKTVPLSAASRVEVEAPLLEPPFATPLVVAPPRLEPEVRDHLRPEPPAEEKPSQTEEAREAEEARKAVVMLVARKILKAVQEGGGQIAKRLMQQRLWRHKRIFKDALGELTARGLVVVQGSMVVGVDSVTHKPSRTLLRQAKKIAL